MGLYLALNLKESLLRNLTYYSFARYAKRTGGVLDKNSGKTYDSWTSPGKKLDEQKVQRLFTKAIAFMFAIRESDAQISQPKFTIQLRSHRLQVDRHTIARVYGGNSRKESVGLRYGCTNTMWMI